MALLSTRSVGTAASAIPIIAAIARVTAAALIRHRTALSHPTKQCALSTQTNSSAMKQAKRGIMLLS